MGQKCLRCGSCCIGALAFIPKTEHSDLSPEKLKTLSEPEFKTYLATEADFGTGNSAPCKWLSFNEFREASCKVHTLRSENCRDYPGESPWGGEYCRVGLGYWRERVSKQLPVPDHVKKILQELDQPKKMKEF